MSRVASVEPESSTRMSSAKSTEATQASMVSALLNVVTTTDSGSRAIARLQVRQVREQRGAPDRDEPRGEKSPPRRIEGQVRVQRKEDDDQRQRGGKGPVARDGSGAPPRAYGQDHRRQPGEQSDDAGLGRYLQHHLVRVAGTLALRAFLYRQEVITWGRQRGIGIAKPTDADTVHRMRGEHP